MIKVRVLNNLCYASPDNWCHSLNFFQQALPDPPHPVLQPLTVLSNSHPCLPGRYATTWHRLAQVCYFSPPSPIPADPTNGQSSTGRSAVFHHCSRCPSKINRMPLSLYASYKFGTTSLLKVVKAKYIRHLKATSSTMEKGWLLRASISPMNLVIWAADGWHPPLAKATFWKPISSCSKDLGACADEVVSSCLTGLWWGLWKWKWWWWWRREDHWDPFCQPQHVAGVNCGGF